MAFTFVTLLKSVTRGNLTFTLKNRCAQKTEEKIPNSGLYIHLQYVSAKGTEDEVVATSCDIIPIKVW